MKWDLTYLFKTENEFEQAYNELKEFIEKFKKLEGTLGDEKNFVCFFELQKELELKLGRTYQYAHLKSDLNRKDVANASKVAQMGNYLSKLNEAMSWSDPEILSLGYDKVMTYINSNPSIQEYKFDMEKLFRKNKHILDTKSEGLLSLYAPILSIGGDLYSALTVSDSISQEVTLSTGKKVMVTQGSWRGLIADNKNKEDRRLIFEAIFNYYEKHKTTYAEIYNLVLQSAKARAKSRNYDSILDSYLFNNNIPTSVFLNLVDVASHNNEAVKKYFSLRKEYLGLDEHYSYDRFLELAHSNKKYSYEEAKTIFLESLKGYPQDFIEKAKVALEDGFVDVLEQDGKRSGAYSSSMVDLHPFILLNYSDTLDDVFTVAHEAGHSMHSLYAMENQPGVLQNYTIFVAEIASTFNEHLLLDYFIKSGKATKEEKIMLLQKAIDEIIGTFYRQTLFAEYEYRASKLVENDQPINYEVLSNIMKELYMQYYGMDISKEKVKEYVWAYIPHLFYTPFYVYQYATSFSASFKLYKNVQEDRQKGFAQYEGLLKSGGSKYPVEQAKDAGVDFTKKDTYLAVVERLNTLVAELEKELTNK